MERIPTQKINVDMKNEPQHIIMGIEWRIELLAKQLTYLRIERIICMVL